MIRRPPRSPLFPNTPLFRSDAVDGLRERHARKPEPFCVVLLELDPWVERAGVHPPHKGPSLRSEEHTSELQSQSNLVCRLLLEKKKNKPARQSTFVIRVAYY